MTASNIAVQFPINDWLTWGALTYPVSFLVTEAGSILVDGEEVVGASGKTLDALQHKIGMLFQNAALFDSLPVWRNVGFGLMQGAGVSAGEAKAVALEKLAAVGLNDSVAELYPAELQERPSATAVRQS